MTNNDQSPITEEELLQLARQQQQKQQSLTRELTAEGNQEDQVQQSQSEATSRLLEAEKLAAESGGVPNMSPLDPNKEDAEYKPLISGVDNSKLMELSGINDVIKKAEGVAIEEKTDGKKNTILSDNFTGTTGLIIDKVEEKKEEDGVQTDLTPEMKDNIESYLKDMEKDFNESKEIRMQLGSIVDPTTLSQQELEEMNHPAAKTAHQLSDKIEVDEDVEFDSSGREVDKGAAKVSQGVVLIDKINSGKLEFTKEEQEKLETVKKIRIEEVESLPMAVTRRHKPKDQLQALKQLRARHGNTMRRFIVALPMSGYTATMAGCSPFEVMSLQADTNNAVNDAMTKWSLIHSKILDTSLGKLSFDEFMKHTATPDMDTLIYGIMCATFPEKDQIELTCGDEDCEKDYMVPYDVRALINFENLSDKSFEVLNQLSDKTLTKEGAEEVHATSALRQNKEFTLPDSGYIVTASPASASRFVDDVLTYSTSDNNTADKSQAIFLSTYVDSISIPEDPLDIKGEYYLFNDFESVVEIVFGLTANDIVILSKMFDEYFEDRSFSFGLRNVTCPSCNTHNKFIEIPVQSMLFYQNSQAMSKE